MRNNKEESKSKREFSLNWTNYIWNIVVGSIIIAQMSSFIALSGWNLLTWSRSPNMRYVIIGSVIVSLAWSDIHQLRKSFIYSTYLLEIKYHNNCIVIRPDNLCIINILNDAWQKTDDHNQDQKVHLTKQNFRHFLGWIYKYFNRF